MPYDFINTVYRTRLYTLKPDKNGKALLDITLGLKITFEDSEMLKVEVSPNEIITITKSEWINRARVWDNNKVFFLVASKHFNQKYAFDVLMNHAVSKIDKRIDYLVKLKEQYSKQLTAA